MKHTRNLLVTLALMAFLTMACSMGDVIKKATGSSSDPTVSSNGSVSDTAKTGIPECDQLIDKIEAKIHDENSNTSYFQRAAYQFMKDQVIKPIADDIANKTPQQKKDIAQKCIDAQHRFDQQVEADKKAGK
jgi:uncharacterized protein YpuA (DUF1002 family)